MTESGAAPAWRLDLHESLPSTSDLLINLARAGEPEGRAILALQQTSGRGSRGRGWTAPTGNLNLSVLLRPNCPARQAGHWALLAGVALWDATVACGARDLTLKWPNDLLLSGRKMAGILIDSATDQEAWLQWIVLGMGVNLASAPDLPGRSLACLADQMEPPAPQDFAPILLNHIGVWMTVLRQDGFPALRAAWMDRAQPLGTPLNVTGPGIAATGRFAGLTEDGALQLEQDGEITVFATGDVLLATG